METAERTPSLDTSVTCAAIDAPGMIDRFYEYLGSTPLTEPDDAIREVAAGLRDTCTTPADALKALSSLVEENPGDAVLARDVSFTAMELGLPAQAFFLLRRVADARPDEPLTYRALAQCLGQMGRADLAIAYYEIALAGQWPGRFGEFRKIAALDYVRLLRRVERGELTVADPAFARERLASVAPLIGVGQADMVVSIMWNTDNTDVDLHVVEPSREECYYGHRTTASGGSLTTDVTTGYGPEMYVLPRAPRGTYLVRAHYYASDRNRASARSKVYATVIEGFGTPRERSVERVVTLETGKSDHPIATISLGETLVVAP